MPRILLITIRPEDDAAVAEYASVLAASALEGACLTQLRIDREPLAADLGDIDGVIVGGSPYDATDPAKSDVQRRVEDDLGRLAIHSVETRLPTLFTCYGIGVAAAALGGSVGREHAEEVGPVAVTLTAEGAADPLFGAMPAVFDAFVGHKESVDALPAGAVLLASSESCPVQAFRAGSTLWATQFHPEPTAAELATRARVYQGHGYFPREELLLVEERITGGSVTEPRRLLERFVELLG